MRSEEYRLLFRLPPDEVSGLLGFALGVLEVAGMLLNWDGV